jgi:hypothetical protein
MVNALVFCSFLKLLSKHRQNNQSKIICCVSDEGFCLSPAFAALRLAGRKSLASADSATPLALCVGLRASGTRLASLRHRRASQKNLNACSNSFQTVHCRALSIK